MKRSTIFTLMAVVAILIAAGCGDEAAKKQSNAGSPFAAMRADMPEAISYSGNFGITLEFEERDSIIFTSDVCSTKDLAKPSKPGIAAYKSVMHGIFDPKFFPNLQWITSDEDQQDAKKALKDLDSAEFINQYEANRYLVLYRTQAGSMVYDFIDYVPPKAELFLLEEYRLTSHLGDYGIGRIINTLSLLPGETTEYQIHNYSSISTMDAASSSIFDSRTEESAESFQEAVMSEESSLDKSSKSFQASASMSASAGWGWGKASAKGSVQNSTNSAREEFARNVSSAVNSHATQASANRSIAVDNSSMRDSVSEEEVFVTRKVTNPNLGRTLNFIFYQMNQEYITLLHLVDISVGLLEADGDVTIVPLYDLQSLLDMAVADSMQEKVRERINSMVLSIRDHKGKIHSEFVIDENAATADTGEHDSESVHRPLYKVDPSYESTYLEPGGRSINVPGIIVTINTIVLRTDGVYVDVLLGQNSALAGVGDQSYTRQPLQTQPEMTK